MAILKALKHASISEYVRNMLCNSQTQALQFIDTTKKIKKWQAVDVSASTKHNLIKTIFAYQAVP